MTSYLYLVASTRGVAHESPIKVGRTSNLQQRLRGLQTSSPTRLEYHDVWDFSGGLGGEAGRMEKCFHYCQRQHRLSGEWFAMEPEHARKLIEVYIHWTYSAMKVAPDSEIYAVERFGVIDTEFDRYGVRL